MNNKQHRKVRYVKCPKCARILPEPEQVPLYTCGGCDTILQAKYYRQQREASVPTLPTEDVQNNGNVHASKVVQSSGDQSPISNKDSNENAVDVGDKICAHPTSLTEESTGLDIKEANSIVGDKEAEKRPIEIETREDGSGQDQYGGDIVVESQDDEQNRNVDYAYEVSTRRELEVLGNRKSQQHATVNEATYDDSDKGEQREDIALDKQEEVENSKSAKEFEPVMQLGTVNVAEGCKVSGNEIKCGTQDKLVGVAKLSKEEKSRTEPKSFIERIRGKLAGVTLTEAVDGYENSILLGGEEASLGAYASHSTSEISQNTDCGLSLSETVNGTSRQKTENLDDCIVDQNRPVNKAGTSAPLNIHNNNLLEGVQRSPTKRSSAYDESVSSSDGNDDQVLGQLDHINREISTGRKNDAKEDERDKGEECEDSALDKQKEVGHGNSAKVSSMAVQYQPNELPEQFGPVNVEEDSRVSGNVINGLAEDVPVGVAKLDKEEKSGKEQKGFIERIREKLASVTSSDEVPVSTEVQNENEHTGVEASLGAASERIASDVLQQPYGEINLTDNVEETWRQNIENLDDSDFSESEQNRPANNAETSEPFDRHEKVGSLLGGVQRSPTKRSPAYDGSVSSCDGNDDKVRRQSERLNGGSFSCAEENSEWIGVPSVRTNYGNLRSQARPKSSSYQLSDEKLTRQLRDGVLPPRMPFHRISSEMAFETGSSSSYLHDEPPGHWTRREPYSQMGYMEGRRFSEASWKENEFFPMYYNDEISGDYHRHSSDSRRRSESLFLSGNLPRTQYSGDVYNRKHQIQDPYIHRRPDARRWSTQLPSGPPGYSHHWGPMTYMDPPGQVKWDPYDPYPINPYGWTYDTIYHSDDQRHKERITKRLHVREKCQAVKRCLRPMAGGAPFITCHFCFTVLQLPEEFLFPKRKKIHRVKCGTCSNILEFSLENDSCLAPRLPYASETDPNRDVMSDSPSRASHSHKSIPVPSEARNSSEALGRERSNSRTKERQAQVTWELPARSKSPLHRLMGYSSPQDLFTDDKE